MAKNIGSVYHYGVFANIREVYLRKNKPNLYKKMRDSGELEKHLRGFQQHCAMLAQEKHQQIAKERGIDSRLLRNNYVDWVTETIKIQEEVREYMIQLINRDMC